MRYTEHCSVIMRVWPGRFSKLLRYIDVGAASETRFIAWFNSSLTQRRAVFCVVFGAASETSCFVDVSSPGDEKLCCLHNSLRNRQLCCLRIYSLRETDISAALERRKFRVRVSRRKRFRLDRSKRMDCDHLPTGSCYKNYSFWPLQQEISVLNLSRAVILRSFSQTLVSVAGTVPTVPQNSHSHQVW